MNNKIKYATTIIVALGVVFVFGVFASHGNISVLSPKGIIAHKQFDLIVILTLLSLVVIVPVFSMLAYILWKYRATNTEAQYDPEWDTNKVAETIMWGIPLILIFIVSMLTWQSSRELDPFKPLASTAKPITIQVVALQWKWLFIYPEQHIATVNYVQFPENTPVNFEITSDAPMNSFWIPQLGGQIYAMAGMSTRLHLMADGVGTYQGSSANLSGRGFADMKFTAASTSQADFDHWAESVGVSSAPLSMDEYTRIASPGTITKVAYYGEAASGLYANLIMKYMMPDSQTVTTGLVGNAPVNDMNMGGMQ